MDLRSISSMASRWTSKSLKSWAGVTFTTPESPGSPDIQEREIATIQPGEQAVEAVSDSGQDESPEREYELLVEEKRDEDRDQNHPEHRKQVRDGNNPG